MALNGFYYEQYEKFCANLHITQEQFEVFLKQFLLTIAQTVIAETKQRQRAVDAIDTGAMINSWYIGSPAGIVLKKAGYKSHKSGKDVVMYDDENSTYIEGIKVIGDELEVEVGNPQEYASWIEYGHHSYSPKYLITVPIDIVNQNMPSVFAEAFTEFLQRNGVE